MKKIILVMTALFTASMAASAQNIELPEVNHNRKTLSVMETLATRHSVREYSDKELSLQDISDLCWAACGLSRDDDHRTAPTARNKQEIRLFVFDKTAAYEYDANSHSLIEKARGDHRKLVAGFQDFVMDAPVSLVMVIDYDIFGSKDENAVRMCCVDAGNVSENINLFCQGAGLVTVPRATMDKKAIVKLLGLTDRQEPIMNNPVGYAKE